VEPFAPRVSWRRELLLIASIYTAYTIVRNRFGSARISSGARTAAYRNAMRVIDIEQALRIFHELAVQQWFLGTAAISFFNVYYGAAHSLITVGVLIWLLKTRPARFRRFRSVLLVTTALGLVGYSTFPLMPPRLLDAGGAYGSGAATAVSYPFTDTLRTGVGLWSFDSGPVDELSNQYAAMPSLHIAWAAWCAVVLFACSRRRWVRWLAILHPIVTLLAIVSTANHYFLDAVAGLATLALGFLVVLGYDRFREQRASINATAAAGRVPC